MQTNIYFNFISTKDHLMKTGGGVLAQKKKQRALIQMLQGAFAANNCLNTPKLITVQQTHKKCLNA